MGGVSTAVGPGVPTLESPQPAAGSMGEDEGGGWGPAGERGCHLGPEPRMQPDLPAVPIRPHIICRPSSWSASTSHPARGLRSPGSPPPQRPSCLLGFHGHCLPPAVSKEEARGVCNFRNLTQPFRQWQILIRGPTAGHPPASRQAVAGLLLTGVTGHSLPRPPSWRRAAKNLGAAGSGSHP